MAPRLLVARERARVTETEAPRPPCALLLEPGGRERPQASRPRDTLSPFSPGCGSWCTPTSPGRRPPGAACAALGWSPCGRMPPLRVSTALGSPQAPVGLSSRPSDLRCCPVRRFSTSLAGRLRRRANRDGSGVAWPGVEGVCERPEPQRQTRAQPGRRARGESAGPRVRRAFAAGAPLRGSWAGPPDSVTRLLGSLPPSTASALSPRHRRLRASGCCGAAPLASAASRLGKSRVAGAGARY